ncbi:Gtp binding protein [Thalictrum thalictroides]|uniref:Gtp binding protein n=1 Tax=Thalictrum thalictroides TaxID=46969 RepID=A0A7J6X249_THATH|nr:Gtp binding protein [Thalictrum thalictroides]
MGREVGIEDDNESLAKRPGVLMVGSANVGKRTLLSRLLDVDFEEASDSLSEVLCYGWTIDTKYYTADVSVWMAHLVDGFSIGSLPISNKLSALVLVFDMNEPSTFATLQDFVSQIDIHKFEILLCIGNKVDLLPGHPAHIEYRRLLQKRAESSSDPHPEFFDYGISESEGSSLLGDVEPSWDLRRSCLEWCIQHNIEYIEACASNAEFDKCLSVDGDSQGVERLYGSLSAHMWLGMILKSGNMTALPYPTGEEESSEEESDYEVEYEILSAGSAEPFDDTEVWVSANGASTSTDAKGPSAENLSINYQNREPDTNNQEPDTNIASHVQPVNTESLEQQNPDTEASANGNVLASTTQQDGDTCFGFEDVEQLMNEIGNVRGNLRLMPDFQRREMAAKLAIKMAAMFGDSSAYEEGFD